MKKEDKIKVGISIGDVNGIGPEIILRTFADSRMLEFCTPVIFGSVKVLAYHRKALNSNVNFQGINDVKDVIHGKLNVINVWNEQVSIELGKPTKTAGIYAIKSLQAAVSSLKKEEVDVLLTAPINKDTIQSDEFNFPGHTDYLAKELEGESLMFMVSDQLKIGLLTDHVPIDEVCNHITEELIINKIGIVIKTLKEDFGVSKPKIAVLGVNPHAGDNGVIGKIDDEIMRPTIQKISEEGNLVYGPFSADSFFGNESHKQFDAVVAAYHDQGLIPFKTLTFGNGINYTAGLNKIRTSPDHGTAYEIAGKGIANINSFQEALFMAIKQYKKRKEYFNLTKNRLKKQRPEESPRN